MQKALFLDRDGTINIEKNYLYKPEDFTFEDGVLDTLNFFHKKGYLLFIITNQSGIARGFFTEKDLFKLNDFIQIKVKNYGFSFKEILYCPHHPNGQIAKYKKICSCRKPENELIETLISKYNISRESSYMVGDKEADIKAGKKSSLTTILVGTGYGLKTKNEYKDYDFFVSKFSDIKKLIQ